MTVRLTEQGVIEAVQAAAWAGSLLFLLLLALIVYLLVRPSRRRPPPPELEEEALDAGEMIRLMDRLEARMEALERIVAERPAAGGKELTQAGEPRPQRRRES